MRFEEDVPEVKPDGTAIAELDPGKNELAEVVGADANATVGFQLDAKIIAGAVIPLVIFLVASYFCYKWNKEIIDNGDVPACGMKTVGCVLCCSVLACCFQIDSVPGDEK